MATVRGFLCCLLIAGSAHAGIPAGGMDILADHWLDQVERSYHTRPGYRGAFGDGPLRLSLYGLAIGGIANNVENASASAIVFATERHLTDRYFAGGSFGTGESDTLEYSHGEIHVGMFANESLALRAGYTNDTYDYLTNDADDANVTEDVLRGFSVGADLFGSPRPGWFVQLSGDLVPLESRLVGGGTRDDLSFTVRGTFLIGFSVFGNLDASLVAMAVPRLGDDQSNAGHFGGGVSLTF